MKNFLYFKNLTVPAGLPGDNGEVQSYPVSGVYFICTSLDQPLEMSVDGGIWFPIEQGFTLYSDGEPFTQLYFRATTIKSATIKFYAGSMELRDSRMSIIKDVSQSSLFMKNAPTINVAGQAALDPGTDAAIVGGYNGQIRKSLMIFNLSAAGALSVQDGAGSLCGQVAAGGHVSFDSSDDFKIKNETAGALSVASTRSASCSSIALTTTWR